MASSAVAQRLFIDIKSPDSIREQVQKLHDIIAPVEGFQGFYWGRFVENPKKCELICLWSSTHFQDLYPDTPQRQKTDILFWKMSVEIPKCHYLPLEPWSSVLSAPVTEMLSFSSLPESIEPSVFGPLIEYIRGSDGCLGVVAGPSTQYGDGVDQKRFLISIGWESIEAHEKGKKAEGFAKLPMALWKKAEMHHVKWEKVESVSERARL